MGDTQEVNSQRYIVKTYSLGQHSHANTVTFQHHYNSVNHKLVYFAVRIYIGSQNAKTTNHI